MLRTMEPRPTSVGSRLPVAGRVAAAAATGIITYLLIDAALRVLEPQYSLLRNAESDYTNGPYAWLMDLNFLLRGGFSLAVVAAIASLVPRRGVVTAGLALMAVWAVGSGLLAFFPDDLAGHAVTTAGRLHLVLALIAFVAVAIGAAVLAYGLLQERAWRPVAPWLVGLAVAGLVALPLVGRPLIRADIGLFERLFLGLELAWLLVAAAWGVRVSRRPAT